MPGSTVSKRSRIFTFEQCQEEDEISEKSERIHTVHTETQTETQIETQPETKEMENQATQTDYLPTPCHTTTQKKWPYEKKSSHSYIGTMSQGVIVMGTALFYRK